MLQLDHDESTRKLERRFRKVTRRLGPVREMFLRRSSPLIDESR